MPKKSQNKFRRPRKRWSQNFLQDTNLAKKVVDSLQIPRPSLVIEVGPGRGVLTGQLIKTADQVIAIEIDPDLARELPVQLETPENLEVITGDILKFHLEGIPLRFPEYHLGIIGNLPYHITSPIIFKVMEQFSHFRQAIFTVQKEVAVRMAAGPGGKEFGILSVLCQFYARVEYLFNLSAGAFYPKPRVDSAAVRFTFQKNAEEKVFNPGLFREIVRITFGQRRKMLRNSLSNLFSSTILDRLKMDLSRRPETLSVEEFVDLANRVQNIQQMSMSHDPNASRH